MKRILGIGLALIVAIGGASNHFEGARTAVRAAVAQLGGVERREDAKRLSVALTRIDEAQRLAGQLNQDANAVAADAAAIILGAIGSSPVR